MFLLFLSNVRVCIIVIVTSGGPWSESHGQQLHLFVIFVILCAVTLGYH
jgi:hypothetical protein